MDEEICKVEGCNNPVKHKKWQECGPHYHRFRTYGDYTTLKRTTSNATWDERLTPDKWTVTPGPLSTPCWLWNPKLSDQGYAVIKYHQKAYKVYRVMWERANGETIPAGMSACHRCDNPACVNPEHIFIGTHDENMRDMISKGRQSAPRGLTDDQVRTIRAAVKGGARQKDVCDAMGIGSDTVSRIVNYKLYKNVI